VLTAKRLALVLVAASASLATGLAPAVMAAPAPNAAAAGTPYHDPSAAGFIGFCDKAGRQITHGNINTEPFAWRAVSSQPALSPYGETGRTATLLAYQPRQDVPAGDWSGDELTASTRYSNPAHPMAAATSGDLSLKGFIGEYRPMWDGLLQMRMFLGAPNQSAYSLTYPATDIKVTGQTWHVVDGGAVDCRSGQAESIESVLLPKSSPTPGSATSPATQSSSGAKLRPASSGSTSAAAGPDAANGVAPSSAALASDTSSGHHTSLIVTVVIVALLLLVIAGYLLSRRPKSRGTR
jgi:hypothetical protein